MGDGGGGAQNGSVFKFSIQIYKWTMFFNFSGMLTAISIEI